VPPFSALFPHRRQGLCLARTPLLSQKLRPHQVSLSGRDRAAALERAESGSGRLKRQFGSSRIGQQIHQPVRIPVEEGGSGGLQFYAAERAGSAQQLGSAGVRHLAAPQEAAQVQTALHQRPHRSGSSRLDQTGCAAQKRSAHLRHQDGEAGEL